MYKWLLVFVLFITGCAHNNVRDHVEYQIDKNKLSTIDALYIRTPGGKVKYHGDIASMSAADSQGEMMYPGGHPAVFIASIFTHAVVNESAKTSAKNKRQQEADKVLEPYKALLDQISYSDLVTSIESENLSQKYNIYRASPSVGMSDSEAILEIMPVFFLTQDQKHFVLRARVNIKEDEKAESPIYSNIIEVTSSDSLDRDSFSFWSDSSNVRALSDSMIVEAIVITLQDLDQSKPKGAKPSTIKYSVSGITRYERGIVTRKSCDRIVIKTLRGWFKSVPRLTKPANACKNELKENTIAKVS